MKAVIQDNNVISFLICRCKRRKTCYPQKKRLNFTLIELLTVISIIAVLASMLLPALQKARQNAAQTKCLGNAKQIGVSLLSYTSDNIEYFPPHYQSTGTGGINRYWPDFLLSYCNGRYESASIPRYISGSIFDCPSSTIKTEATLCSYTYHLLYWPLSSYSIYSMGVKYPSRTGIIADGAIDNGTYIGAKIGMVGDASRNLRNRHLTGLNILFCDGHVSWRSAFLSENLGSMFRYDSR